MIYLDTNVMVWLAGAPEQLSQRARDAINKSTILLFSPMVELEIEYLHETGRIALPAHDLLAHLRSVLNLRRCERPFGAVVSAALDLKWTRDPFDRIITAQAGLGNDILLTRDKTILGSYPHAVW